MEEARDIALCFFTTELWEVKEEEIDALEAEETANYGKAQLEGMHATFNYWHKTE